MIEQIINLFRAVHREVPDATIEEISAVIRANPGADANALALAIWANRPDDDDDDDDDDDLDEWERQQQKAAEQNYEP